MPDAPALQPTEDGLPSDPASRPATVQASDQAGPAVEAVRKLKYFRNKTYRLRKQSKEARGKQHSAPKLTRSQRKANLIKELHYFLPKPAANFVETQVRLADKPRRGRRWTEEDKTIALSLYHSSRKAYTLLGKIFVLPSLSTLKKNVQNVKIYPEFNENILRSLAQKVQAVPENSQLCTVVFDEMCIKEKVVYNIERDEVEGFKRFWKLREDSGLLPTMQLFLWHVASLPTGSNRLAIFWFSSNFLELQFKMCGKLYNCIFCQCSF